jgi:hypothetical protein
MYPKCFNVIVAWNLWPVFREHAAGIVFDFTKGDRFKAAGTFKAQRESRRCPKTDQAL